MLAMYHGGSIRAEDEEVTWGDDGARMRLIHRCNTAHVAQVFGA